MDSKKVLEAMERFSCHLAACNEEVSLLINDSSKVDKKVEMFDMLRESISAVERQAGIVANNKRRRVRSPRCIACLVKPAMPRSHFCTMKCATRYADEMLRDQRRVWCFVRRYWGHAEIGGTCSLCHGNITDGKHGSVGNEGQG